MGAVSPGPEHLLLSALGMDDGTARRAFARVGADADGFAVAVAAGHDAAFRATPAGQRAFQAAATLSKQVTPSRLPGARGPDCLNLKVFEHLTRRRRSPILRGRVRRAATDHRGRGGSSRFPVGPPGPHPGPTRLRRGHPL
jgi:hypothetical protein